MAATTRTPSASAEAQPADPPGIVILDRRVDPPASPRIEAFVYGGESGEAQETLPYGRWREIA